MKKQMSKGTRAYLKLQILRKAKQNPEFEKELIQRMNEKKAQEPEDYLTEAHRKNEEAGEKQIEEWQKTPLILEEIMQKQREREQQ
jgi:hypothetical protein